jgi:thiosulfate dehydrogenase (quinone) large subunit
MTAPGIQLDRREICLGILGLAALACGGGGGSTGMSSPPPPPAGGLITTTETKAGFLALPAGHVASYISTSSAQCPGGVGARQGAYLVRDAQGIYAISASCLHQGGRLDPAGNGFSCPCHGSQYDLGGTVLVGPATVGSVLPHYQVRESTPGGPLVIDTTVPVDDAVRLA